MEQEIKENNMMDNANRMADEFEFGKTERSYMYFLIRIIKENIADNIDFENYSLFSKETINYLTEKRSFDYLYRHTAEFCRVLMAYCEYNLYIHIITDKLYANSLFLSQITQFLMGKKPSDYKNAYKNGVKSWISAIDSITHCYKFITQLSKDKNIQSKETTDLNKFWDDSLKIFNDIYNHDKYIKRLFRKDKRKIKATSINNITHNKFYNKIKKEIKFFIWGIISLFYPDYTKHKVKEINKNVLNYETVKKKFEEVEETIIYSIEKLNTKDCINLIYGGNENNTLKSKEDGTAYFDHIQTMISSGLNMSMSIDKKIKEIIVIVNYLHKVEEEKDNMFR